MATPFVQGRLREEYLTATITTECAHCGRAMRIEVNSELEYRVTDEGAAPLVSLPHINWATFTETNIIGAY